jgi:hypothetical protein
LLTRVEIFDVVNVCAIAGTANSMMADDSRVFLTKAEGQQTRMIGSHRSVAKTAGTFDASPRRSRTQSTKRGTWLYRWVPKTDRTRC